MLVDGQPAWEEGEEFWHVCAVGMHPSMSASPVVGMLACWDANQQHRQTSMTTTEVLAEVAWPWLWMLGCTPAPSTQHPAILGYTRGCWPCGHVPPMPLKAKKMVSKGALENSQMGGAGCTVAGLYLYLDHNTTGDEDTRLDLGAAYSSSQDHSCLLSFLPKQIHYPVSGTSQLPECCLLFGCLGLGVLCAFLSSFGFCNLLLLLSQLAIEKTSVVAINIKQQ
jgi:hypothetical protein